MRLLFAEFELDSESCQLFRAGVEVQLERRAMDLLMYLAAHPDRLVGREELLEQVWHTRNLSPGVLANAVAKLRKALGQAADEQAPIETVRGRGYRLRARGSWPAAAPEDQRAAPAPEPLDPFVGRLEALAQLSSALERALAGAGQLRVVAGEAGIGKTRLVREFEQRAKARGFSVWRGSAHDGEFTPAYWPWAELLRTAHEQLPTEVWGRASPAGRAAVEQLVPALGRVASQGDDDEQRLRFALFDGMTQVLRAACRAAPRLLVIDDLHWADAAAIEMLAYCARALADERLLCVVTLRDRDVAFDERRAAALRRLDHLATRVPLAGLSSGEVAQLLRALAGGEAGDPRLTEAMVERTHGNPLFVRQLWDWLRSRGELGDAGLAQLATAELPPALRALIQQRIAGLAAETRDVLSLAAVVGREFDAETLAAVLGASLARVLAALEPALAARVIGRDGATASHRYAFVHGLLRDVLYEGLGAAQCGALHAKLALALSERARSADPRVLSELAGHLLLAVPCDLAVCVEHCGKAALAARRSSGFEAAAELIARLIQKHESEAGDLRQRCELLRLLALDQFCADDPAAWGTMRRGVELARQLQDGALLGRFALHMARWSTFGDGDRGYVAATLEDAQRSLGADDAELRTSLLAHRAAAELSRSPAERTALLVEAEAAAGARPPPQLTLQLAFARVVLADPLLSLAGKTAPVDDIQDRGAVARFRALDGRLRAAGDLFGLHQAFFVEMIDYMDALTLCELEAADEAAARCRALADMVKMSRLDVLVALIDAGRALGDGRLSALEQAIGRLREASLLGGGLGVAWIPYSMLLALERGEFESWQPPVKPPQLLDRLAGQQTATQISFAWTLAQRGQVELARQLVRALTPAALAHLPQRRGDLGPLCILAEVYVAVGEREAAARLFEQLAPFAGLNAVGQVCEYYGSVAYFLGRLALLLGRQAEAALHLEQAERVNRALGMPLQLARTRAQRATALSPAS